MCLLHIKSRLSGFQRKEAGMKNRNICKLLAITVIVTMLSAGCGASNAAPAKEEAVPEATEATVTEEETVTEETTEVETVADTSEAAKPEEKGASSTESQDTTAEVKFLPKTMKSYIVSEDGKKNLRYEEEYEYDDNGNCIHRSTTSYQDDMDPQKSETNAEYDEEGHCVKEDHLDSDGKVTGSTSYEYERNEEGRTIRETRSEKYYSEYGDTESSFITQYSYNGDQFTCDTYHNDVIVGSAKGFVLDGENYMTEEKFYDTENPKTEDDETYSSKSIKTYEGNRVVKDEEYDNNGEMNYEASYEYELDENNNPITVKAVVKYIDGDVSTAITEYTYIQLK